MRPVGKERWGERERDRKAKKPGSGRVEQGASPRRTTRELPVPPTRIIHERKQSSGTRRKGSDRAEGKETGE